MKAASLLFVALAATFAQPPAAWTPEYSLQVQTVSSVVPSPDGKLITLDQDGYLMLADPSPKGFKVAAKSKLLTNLSWTPPVLVGTRLYLRDRKTIMAVDLG